MVCVSALGYTSLVVCTATNGQMCYETTVTPKKRKHPISPSVLNALRDSGVSTLLLSSQVA